MSERSLVGLRLTLAALVVANVLFFGYTVLAPDPRAQAGSRIDELQINPGRIKLMGSATRGPGGVAGAQRACLEWGPFAASDLARVESALARLSLPQRPLQRPVGDSTNARRFSYFVREPDAGIVAQIAELQRGFPGSEIRAGPCPG